MSNPFKKELKEKCCCTEKKGELLLGVRLAIGLSSFSGTMSHALTYLHRIHIKVMFNNCRSKSCHVDSGIVSSRMLSRARQPSLLRVSQSYIFTHYCEVTHRLFVFPDNSYSKGQNFFLLLFQLLKTCRMF